MCAGERIASRAAFQARGVSGAGARGELTRRSGATLQTGEPT
ncbi:hypothetical protein QUF95_18875 [Paenibacillus silvae]|nr:hypothetical protein [Paenibacillus silvae]MDM5279465.1 hypothetical protein [Paenibacillus silvae]